MGPKTVVLHVTNQTELFSLCEIPRGHERDGVEMVEHGSDLTCVLTLLERLTVDQLDHIALWDLRAIKQRVTRREDARLLAERIAANVDREWGGTLPPPEAGDALADDEDDPEDTALYVVPGQTTPPEPR